MKTKNKEEAKGFAKVKAIIKTARIYLYLLFIATEFFYADTISLTRMWEQIIGCYVNGVFTAEE
ncbi:MAG TPA: hypothetical protein PLU27_00575 [Ginsengibacter sp.]|nr:hypothetical protein [Ginsengibacter sp.]HRP43237.1 hypothetical protein [Ginsengibacter sp.]